MTTVSQTVDVPMCLLYRYNYHLASRTLCPFLHGFIPLAGLETNESFSIDVSTSSPEPVNYTLKAEFAEKFVLS